MYQIYIACNVTQFTNYTESHILLLLYEHYFEVEKQSVRGKKGKIYSNFFMRSSLLLVDGDEN